MNPFIVLIIIFMLGLFLMAMVSITDPTVKLHKEFKCYIEEPLDKYVDNSKYAQLVFEEGYILNVDLATSPPSVFGVSYRDSGYYGIETKCPDELHMSQYMYGKLKEKGIIDILEGK